MKTSTLFAAAILLATSIAGLAPTKTPAPGPSTPIPICPGCGRGGNPVPTSVVPAAFAGIL